MIHLVAALISDFAFYQIIWVFVLTLVYVPLCINFTPTLTYIILCNYCVFVINIGIVKRPVKRRQRAPRPASPYSTDSNYSAILAVTPHKPYPKSERRRQLASNGRQGRHHGRHGNSAGNQGNAAAVSPALRPLPRKFATSLFCLVNECLRMCC